MLKGLINMPTTNTGTENSLFSSGNTFQNLRGQIHLGQIHMDKPFSFSKFAL